MADEWTSVPTGARGLATAVVALVVIVAVSLLWSEGRSVEVEQRAPVADRPADAVAETPEPAPAAARAEEAAVEDEAESRAAVEPAARGAAAEKPRVVVRARLVDEAGAPLAGFEARAADIVDHPAAASGADGRVTLVLDWPFRLERGNEHWVVVEVRREGWTPLHRQEAIRGPSEVELGDLVLHPAPPAGTIVGRVLDTRGAPVADARVTAVRGSASAALTERQRIWGRDLPWMGVAWQGTDAAGGYRLEDVRTGSVAVLATHAGHEFTVGEPLDVPEGGEVRAPDLVLEPLNPEHAIRGRVLDAEGAPVRQASLGLFENRGQRNIEPLAGGRSDERGAFEVRCLPGTYTLTAKDPDGLELIRHDVPAGTEGLELRYPPTRWVEVELRGADDAPVTGARVFLHSEDGYTWDPGGAEEVRPGEYRLRALTGPFLVWTQAEGYRTADAGPFDPETVKVPIVVVLERGTPVGGRVLAGGKPVAGAKVHAHRAPGWSKLVRYTDRGLFSALDPTTGGRAPLAVLDENGAFELPLQEAGTYTLHAEAEGRARAESAPLEVTIGEPVMGVELEFPEPAALIGDVLTAEGVSPAGTIVGITRGDGHVLFQAVAEDGGFRFETLAPGPWQVLRCRVEDQEWMRMERSWPEYDRTDLPVDVELAPGATTRYDIDLRDELPCTVEGTLSLGREPASGWYAILWVKGRGSERSATDSSGRFTVHAKASGEGILYLDSAASQDGEIFLRQNLSLSPGENRWDLDLEVGSIELNGLLRGETPLDVEGFLWEYALLWRDEHARLHWQMGFDPGDGGRFVAEHVPAGRVELRRQEEIGGDFIPESWPVLATIEVCAGERAAFELASED